MATSTKIEWTEQTWNVSTGCTKISEGCANCYAEKMTRRLHAMGQTKYENGFNLTLHQPELLTPYTWKKPRRVFVNSMSDLFHESMPLTFIKDAFKVMNDCSLHTFQVLTKRAYLLEKHAKELNFTTNIWVGVTVESSKHYGRIESLRRTNAAVKFLSIEPMLSAMPNLNLNGIDWVIVGGESGPGSREIKEEWVTDIKAQCEKAGVPFFFKQWGGVNKKKTGSLLQGKSFKNYPELTT